MIDHISSPAHTLFDLRPPTTHVHPLLAEIKKTVSLVHSSCSFTFLSDNLHYHVFFHSENVIGQISSHAHTLLDPMPPTPHARLLLAEHSKKW